MGVPATTALPVNVQSEDRAIRLAALFDTHQDRLYRLARRLVATADDANDLVQETFLRVARSARATPTGVAEEEAWLVRILINLRRDQWRRIAIRGRGGARCPTVPEPAASSHEAACIARATVWQALDSLAPRRRAVIVMHELDGMLIPAIASLLGISAITVRWHLSVGRRELTRILKMQEGESR